jgi:hypothetical protein
MLKFCILADNNHLTILIFKSWGEGILVGVNRQQKQNQKKKNFSEQKKIPRKHPILF